MGNNGHLQPRSHLPPYIMAGELKVLETNLKSEEIICILSHIFTDFDVLVIKIAMFYCDFLYFL